MEKIKDILTDYLKRPLITGVIGLLLGLIIGLPILGWGLWPVKWKDADASFLRQDLKEQYLCMVVDSYRVNQDASLAAARLDSLKENLQTNPTLFNSLSKGGCSYVPDDKVVLALKSALLGLPSTGQPVVSETTIPLPTATPDKEAKKGSGALLAILCALFLIIGAVLVYLFFFRNRRNQDDVPAPIDEGDDFEQVEPVETVEEEEPVSMDAPITTKTAGEGPVSHFMTTYVIGDDLYDDSFSIDAPSGEFLGECGASISDTIGVGDPKKITALEVWLFDKNDTQTVTKVLMSEHAINDAAIRQRLASRGEPIQVEPGQQILLETATLQLEARVIEMVYGQGAMPSGSYFERLTMEMTVWQK